MVVRSRSMVMTREAWRSRVGVVVVGVAEEGGDAGAVVVGVIVAVAAADVIFAGVGVGDSGFDWAIVGGGAVGVVFASFSPGGEGRAGLDGGAGVGDVFLIA